MIEIQVGLSLKKEEKQILDKVLIRIELISSEGYCFYDSNTNEENRLYYKYMLLNQDYAYKTNEELNEEFVSIPISEIPSDKEVV